MKTITIKALMLLTLAIPSLHGAASWQRLWNPTRTYAGTYWQQQAPRFFSSSLPRYAVPTADEIKAEEEAQEARRKALRSQFANQYWNTVRSKVAGGMYEYNPTPLANIKDPYWIGEYTKNVRTKPMWNLAGSYANIMMNKTLTPEQTQIALKELAKEQGRTIAAEHQWEAHYQKMRNLLDTLTNSADEAVKKTGLSMNYAHKKQLGARPDAYRNIMDYVSQQNIKSGKSDIWNRTPEQRELMDLLKD